MYINNQIDEDKDIYLIKKITGYILEMLQLHYDRSDIRKIKAETVAKTISKKKQVRITVDLDNVYE